MQPFAAIKTTDTPTGNKSAPIQRVLAISRGISLLFLTSTPPPTASLETIKALTGRIDATKSPETIQQQPFGTAVLGDASEALGRVGTADGGDTMGSAGGPPAVPIHFKELAALTRRGTRAQRVHTTLEDVSCVHVVCLFFLNCVIWSRGTAVLQDVH